MAGTINLSLSQQFSNAGKRLSGGKLYFYQAATTTPQNAYKDTALTRVHPNPIVLDSSGRVPEFWLADGNIKFVLTDKSGVVQISSTSTQVLGPSSGSGSGSTVDSTTIFQTGDSLWLMASGTRSGWVRDNGRTIGSATSGASERANSDCQLLYVFLWTTYSDTICPVNGGRGISAAADWAANKYIGLPDLRGYVPGGLDGMGNSPAGRYASVPIVSGGVDTAASVLGEATKALTQANLPSLNLTVTIPTSQTNVVTSVTGHQGPSYGTGPSGPPLDAVNVSSGSLPQLTGTAATGGSGAVVNKVQSTILGTFYQKL